MRIFNNIQSITAHSRNTVKRYIKLKKRKLLKTNSMPFLQLHITDHCNLNCKGCAHFSPIAEERFIDLDDMELMYKQLLPFLENQFSRFELMGGEPLLHPQIEEIIIRTRKYFPNIEIRLVTNGIKLFSMKKRFFQICSKYNIIIYISKYPINLDYDLLIKKLDNYHVKYNFYGNYNDYKMFIEYKLNPEGIYNARHNYMNCKLGGRCLQLKDNRIYPCFVSAYAKHLNHYFNMNFEWKEEDYLSLDSTLTKEKISHFINEPVPFCRYCSIEKQFLTKWEVSERSKKEWIDLD